MVITHATISCIYYAKLDGNRTGILATACFLKEWLDKIKRLFSNSFSMYLKI
jgi:hypothetical protein